MTPDLIVSTCNSKALKLIQDLSGVSSACLKDNQIHVSFSSTHLSSVIQGPCPSDLVASSSFNQLWGPLAGIRRFKDGTIKLAVAFDDISSFAQKSSTIVKLIKHLLARHLDIHCSIWSNQFNDLIIPFIDPSQSFLKLSKLLKSIQLPLSITLVSRLSTRCAPFDILLHLESSTRWPDEFYAIQRMKLALFLQLKGKLEVIGVVSCDDEVCICLKR